VSTGQILLVPRISITCDQPEEASVLGRLEQIAIRESGPAPAAGGYDLETRKSSAQPIGGILIEDNADRH
jgi:hypothetical protein